MDRPNAASYETGNRKRAIMSNTELQFYLDTIIIETVLSDNKMMKTAQSSMVGSLIDKVKGYVEGHIDPNNKAGSVINILTPGILTALGFPIIGFLTKLAQMFFGMDVSKIFSSVAEKVKSWLGSGQNVSSQQVDAAVDGAVSENYGSEPTQENLNQFMKIKSMTLRDAQLFKIALDSIMQEVSLADLDAASSSLHKRAQIVSSLLKFVGLKHKTASILGKIIGWIFKAVLASAGFMVAGDVVNKLLNRKDTPSTSSAPSAQISLITPKQNIFAVNPNYQEEKLNITSGWLEPVPPDQIGDQIVRWAEDIYPDLKDLDNVIRSSTGFQAVVNQIQQYNINNTSNITFMPKIFTSRKKVVDLFIDELANRARSLPNAPNSTPNKTPGIAI
jgi:hypothetical protein